MEAGARVASRISAWARGRLSFGVHGVAAVWFVLALVAVLWGDGLDPHIFLTPDETANRVAATLISETGHPFLKLPFEDPENLAHMRAWLSRGDVALPIYPPVTLYFYALLAYLGRLGSLVLVLVPASAVAAFAAGSARLLPPARRWLALFAPALGMASLYWLLRPWMNICALLTCVCWAFNCWSVWRVEKRTGWVTAAMLCLGAGVAARPDYTAYVLLVALLLGLGAEPARFRRLLVLTVCAGAFALGANMLGNTLVTGHPLRAAYQLVISAEQKTEHLNPVLQLLKLLFFPMTFPGWGVVTRELLKYWVFLGPTWLLLLAQGSLYVVLKRSTRAERVAVFAVLVVALVFMISRVDSELFGLNRSEGYVNDSIPRYLSPVFLLASVPPLLALGGVRRRSLLVVGSLALGVLAAGNLVAVVRSSPQSVMRHHELVAMEQRWLDRLATLIPRDSIVYTPTWDKVLGSTYRVGTFDDDADLTATSMRRALDHSLPVYLWTHHDDAKSMRTLERAAKKQHLELVKIDKSLRLYRLERERPAVPNF